jgi:signal transduction histidine kinase
MPDREHRTWPAGGGRRLARVCGHTDALSLLGHELRTPVASIRAAATTLRERAGDLDDDARDRLLAIVDSQASLLARMLDDVLAAARLDDGRLPVEIATADAGRIAHEAAAAAAAAAPAGRAVVARGPASASARCDPDRLRQVLANLTENALRHGDGTVEVLVEPVASAVRIAVSDEGRGIPEADRERIFARYERLDTRSSGTGLGLWLARELVERMGGTLTLSADRACTTFVVELPGAG